MKCKVRRTVIGKKIYLGLQGQYCADPNSGVCSCYNTSDAFAFSQALYIDEKAAIR